MRTGQGLAASLSYIVQRPSSQSLDSGAAVGSQDVCSAASRLNLHASGRSVWDSGPHRCSAFAAPGAKHVICFTDSYATAEGLTAASGSDAPQLSFLVRWLCERRAGMQFLGMHQRGLRNVTSDRLSRGHQEPVLQELSAAGIHVRSLSPTADTHDLLDAAVLQPLLVHH